MSEWMGWGRVDTTNCCAPETWRSQTAMHWYVRPMRQSVAGAMSTAPEVHDAVCAGHPLPHFGGVFAQRGHSALTVPNITLLIPETPLQTTPLQKRAWSIQNSIGGAEFRTLGPVATIRPKQKIPGVPAGAVGCRIRDPGTPNDLPDHGPMGSLLPAPRDGESLGQQGVGHQPYE